MEQETVNPQFEERNPETDGTSTTMSGLLSPPEIIVDEVINTPVTDPDNTPMMEVRVNDTLDEMTYLAGNKRYRYKFVEGQRYNVPVFIAAELDGLGKLWH